MNKSIIRDDVVHGIHLRFEDLKESGTVAFVFGELKNDYYGLERISLSEKDTVIDIGANVGMFSIYIRKKFGCRVIAFEPVPLNIYHFKRNILLNNLTDNDIEIHQTAITSQDENIIRIGTPFYNTGGSSVFHISNSTECHTEILHKYIDSTCRYLKIDCEGCEYEIIPSIINEINHFDYIGIEYHKYINSQDPHSLHDLLRKSFNGIIFYKEFGS